METTLKVYPPDDPVRPSRPEAGLGLIKIKKVMVVVMMILKSILIL